MSIEHGSAPEGNPTAVSAEVARGVIEVAVASRILGLESEIAELRAELAEECRRSRAFGDSYIAEDKAHDKTKAELSNTHRNLGNARKEAAEKAAEKAADNKKLHERIDRYRESNTALRKQLSDLTGEAVAPDEEAES